MLLALGKLEQISALVLIFEESASSLEPCRGIAFLPDFFNLCAVACDVMNQTVLHQSMTAQISMPIVTGIINIFRLACSKNSTIVSSAAVKDVDAVRPFILQCVEY